MKKVIFVVCRLAAMYLTTASSVWAQDPVEVAPEIYQVQLENGRVRVLDIRAKPGGKIPTHSHPAHVVVALSPCKGRFTQPGGKTTELELQSGEVAWSGPTTHSVENVGRAECHVLNIELK
jgi:quercetin dioxygenase-like cupin family protein